MAIHWQIQFVSLRSHTTYVLNIYDASYSGSPVQLKGGSEPFTTEEEADEDMFKPLRTQSGSFRVVDDGKDANGNTLSAANSLKAMLPATDTDRPVQLTKKVGNTWVVLWMGYMQAQNFGSVLYGDPQEREFPVQCCLSVHIMKSMTNGLLWLNINVYFGTLLMLLIFMVPKAKIDMVQAIY